MYYVYIDPHGHPNVLTYQLPEGTEGEFQFLYSTDVEPELRDKKFVNGEWVHASEEPEYSRKRRKHYPKIGDQLDALWKIVGSLGTDMGSAREILAQIQEVKNKYPKQANTS